MRILLSAYACQPGYAAEPKNGWQWAQRYSERHEVILLTHPRGRKAIEEELARHPDLRVVYVELPKFLDPWERVSERRYVRIRYCLWQIAAYFVARRIVRSSPIDVVHHATWATLSGPTFAWALGRPFVFGPAGGGQLAPLRMRHFLGWKASILEMLRNARVRAMRWNPILRLTAQSAAYAVASNLESFEILKAHGARRLAVLPDTAIDPAWAPDSPPVRKDSTTPVVLWMGRLEAHKALGLALHAFSALPDANAELWILGDGPLRRSSEKLAHRLGIGDRVRFYGWVPHADTSDFLLRADVFLFTSLRDSCPQVVMEAAAWGLPVVAIDHQGLWFYPKETAVKVPLGSPSEVAAGLTGGLSGLLRDPSRRRIMGRAAWQWVQDNHLWQHRIDFVEGCVLPHCVPESTRFAEVGR